MSKLNITAKELRAIGFPESSVIPVAMRVAEKLLPKTENGEQEISLNSRPSKSRF